MRLTIEEYIYYWIICLILVKFYILKKIICGSKFQLKGYGGFILRQEKGHVDLPF